jgi:hypothetical protein
LANAETADFQGDSAAVFAATLFVAPSRAVRRSHGREHPFTTGHRKHGGIVKRDGSLKFFQQQGRFPKSAREVPRAVVDRLASQLEVAPERWNAYDRGGRTIKSYRSEIRRLLGFREATVADGETPVDWLCDRCLPQTQRLEHLESAAYERLRSLHLEPPTPARLDRSIRSAQHAFVFTYTKCMKMWR